MQNGINLNNVQKAHFIGIGGIGVSAIARMMILEGKKVSGSDSSFTMITDELKVIGAKVYEGQKPEQVPDDAGIIVYSPAVPADNPERAVARERGIPELSYPEVLDLISREKYTIAVSGTHGKTTTTAMIAEIMKDAELDPTVVVGSLLKGAESNFIAGKSKYFVVEACEFKRSFLNLSPNILVITNIDNDHLDYYKDIKDIQSAFHELAQKVSTDGYIICDPSQPYIADVIKGVSGKIVDYAVHVHQDVSLLAPGEHNRKNAAAARAVADILGVKQEKIIESLSHFAGTWRRFEFRGNTSEGALLFDDYAHHPTEIKATLSGAREAYPDKRITVVFQPHLFSRTKLLLDQFAKSFSDADRVVILPIYASREKFDPSISAEILSKEISKNHTSVTLVSGFDEAITFLKKDVSVNDVIITMGAGDVYKAGDSIL